MGKNVINRKESKEEKEKILQNVNVLISLFKKYIDGKDERKELFFTSVAYAVLYVLYTAGACGKSATWEEKAERFIELLRRIKDDIPKLKPVQKGDCWK